MLRFEHNDFTKKGILRSLRRGFSEILNDLTDEVRKEVFQIFERRPLRASISKDPVYIKINSKGNS